MQHIVEGWKYKKLNEYLFLILQKNKYLLHFNKNKNKNLNCAQEKSLHFNKIKIKIQRPFNKISIFKLKKKRIITYILSKKWIYI